MPVVLVVDDDPGILDVLRLTLADEGYTPLLARNGQEALTQLSRYHPELVLLDLMMPRMSGWEVLATMRRHGIRTPVVFMSAGMNAQAEALAYGADDFLPKPFTLDALLDVVARHTASTTPAPPGGRPFIMPDGPAPPTVAILNSNDDLLRLLRSIVEGAGFASVTAHVGEVGRSEAALREVLARHNPRVVLFDISPPYPENWALCVAMREAESTLSTGRQFLVTTTNKRALEERVGPTQALELAGDRLDRDAIVAAIQRAVIA